MQQNLGLRGDRPPCIHVVGLSVVRNWNPFLVNESRGLGYFLTIVKMYTVTDQTTVCVCVCVCVCVRVYFSVLGLV